MSKLRVKENKIYLDRPLKPEMEESAARGFVQGVPANMLKDEELETHRHRRNFTSGEGDYSILVEVGEELGEIHVGLQFEGPIGEYTECLTKQNDLLQDGSTWLKEIFDQFGEEWEVNVASVPCPKGDTRILRVEEAVSRLENRNVSVASSVNNEVAVGVTVRNEG